MKDKLIYLAVLVPILVVTVLLQVYKVEPFESFSLRFNDVNFDLQKKEISKNVVFVAIDEPSVNKFGRWPWNREVLAEGMSNLNQADVVLMDMIFSEPTTKEQDSALAETISSLNNSVCGFFLRHNATQDIGESELEILTDSSLDMLQAQISENGNPSFVPAPFAEMNIYPILEACTLSGSFSTLAEADHLLRSYPIAVYFKNLLYPSLAIQGLRIKLNKDIYRFSKDKVEINGKVIGLDEKGFVRLNYYNIEQYDIVSFLDVANQKVKPEYFEGKIVILGITDVGAGDIVTTPIGSIPGPLLHYTFISNLLQDHIIVEPKNITTLLIFFMVLTPLVWMILFKKIITRVSINFAVYLITYILVRYLFVSQMVYIDMFFPLIALLLSVAAVESIAFNLQEKNSKFLTDTFSSYLSGDLLNQLIEHPDSLKLGGEKKELSILFSDIRGFTTLSESMEPEALIEVLNRYFTPMTQSVLENGGMLDKYIGDAVMAFYNAPVDVEKHADASCLSALSMIERLNILNKELESENIPQIRIGIGINTAEVIVGNIGSDAKKDYTVIGDGVNLASRVEGLTKNYGIEILITEFTVNRLTNEFLYREIEPVKVKGKDEAVLLYELMAKTDRNLKLKSLYDDAMKVYKDNDFAKAEYLLAKLVEEFNDSVSSYFLEQVKNKHPWGVHKMTTK
ncbi:CHASE2 domain-containing protein [Sulfurimonas sp.]|uniref:CHASE2 domain-containing protein n=1 Tax=Sulfurimonas sp. TaxID=2022749 RepID=UPI003562B7D1